MSFSFTDRKGIEQEVFWDYRGNHSRPWESLSSFILSYKNMDPKIYQEIVKYRGGVFNNPAHIEKFKGYLKI